MKYLARFALMLVAFIMVPLSSLADGSHAPGFVQVTQLFGGSTMMYGQFNVRYNPNVTRGLVMASYNPGSNIVIAGEDSNSGVGFSCTISTTSPFYAAAEKTVQALGNGSGFSAIKPQTSTECSSFNLQISSRFLN